eukprot:168707-Chlamydomonas_euryale.AAC.4
MGKKVGARVFYFAAVMERRKGALQCCERMHSSVCGGLGVADTVCVQWLRGAGQSLCAMVRRGWAESLCDG